MAEVADTVRAFPARIVRQQWAATVVCPMHDALTPQRRQQILTDNLMSYLQVTRSRFDLPDATPDEIGSANAAGLEHLLTEGAYSELSPPALYVYRVHLGSEEHTGIVADIDVSGFADGRVLGHEAVHQGRVAALVRHFEAVPMRSELVTLIHRNDDDVAAVVSRVTAASPILSFTDTTGVEQMVWRLPDSDAELVAAKLNRQRLFIADGHHRVAATVQRWRDHGSPRGGEVLSVLYAENQVHLLAFHRIVHGDGGPLDTAAVVDALRSRLAVTEIDTPKTSPGTVCVRLGHQWLSVSLGGESRQLGSEGLDVTLLDELILMPVLGVRSGDDRVEYLSEFADLNEAVQRVDQQGGALFMLTAPALDRLIDVAERGEVMPQKSTYIEPKPRAGVLLRPRLGPVDPRQLPSVP